MFPRPSRARLDDLRNPAYTGANRCVPCTVVNLVLAAALGAVAAVVWLPLAPAVVLLSLLSIYFRGYLVPGTPALTKRYLPDRVLAWFGKTTEQSRTDRGERGPRLTSDLGAESTLRTAGVLESVQTEEAAGTRLTAAFRTAWLDALDDSDPVGVEEGVRATFGADAETTPVGGDLTTVVDGQRLVGWETEAALRADVAAAELLAARDEDWAERDGADRQELLSTLRAYLDRCPDCAGTVELTDSLVDSCCRPTEREVTAECVDCGTTLLDVGETV